MTNNKSLSSRLPLSMVLVFFIATAILVLGKTQLELWGVDAKVLAIGNLILFTVTLASYLLYKRAMEHPSTMGFLRNTYGGVFLKLLVCIIAIMIYVVSDREHVNKPAIFSCVFLYFVYTLLEMYSLMQWNKARRNA